METRIVEVDLGDGFVALVRAVEVPDDAEEAAEKVVWADRFDFTEVSATLAGIAQALLQSARSVGIAEAYHEHAQRRWARVLLAMLDTWIETATWTDSKAYLEEHHDELCSEETAGLLRALAGHTPRDLDVRLHLGLLELAIAGGVEAAYALLEPGARRDGLAIEAANGFTDRLLALARIESGLSPDASEAHFRLAVVLLLRGSATEAAGALGDCADHAAPFERADFLRRLDRLASEHPEVADTVAELRVFLEP